MYLDLGIAFFALLSLKALIDRAEILHLGSGFFQILLSLLRTVGFWVLLIMYLAIFPKIYISN